MSWDSSDSTINSGYGINQWRASGSYEGSDLMQLLNGEYLSKQNVEDACYNWTTEEMGTCNFSSTGMSSAYTSMIENVVWNTGALDWDDPLIYDPDTEILAVYTIPDVLVPYMGGMTKIEPKK